MERHPTGWGASGLPASGTPALPFWERLLQSGWQLLGPANRKAEGYAASTSGNSTSPLSLNPANVPQMLLWRLRLPELPGCSDWWTRRANMAPRVPLQLGTTLGEPLKGGDEMETSVSSDGGFLTETENGNRRSISEARFQLWRRVGGGKVSGGMKAEMRGKIGVWGFRL